MAAEKTLAALRQAAIDDPAVRRELLDEHVRAIVRQIVCRGPGVDVLVMGRPEGPGCFCAINDLLRYGIQALSREYDFVIVDGEAGPEQINRRVLSDVDTLVIVTDPSARAVRAAREIASLAAGGLAAGPGRIGVVINRAPASSEEIGSIAARVGVELFGSIPEDPAIARFDSEGRPLTELPDESRAVQAADEILRKLVPFR